MSSDLKDARWQLAIDWAAEDGLDFLDLSYDRKQDYLVPADMRLALTKGEAIERLAHRFRTES